ncbi:MAG: polyphenol oxidase family protein [Pseudomonadota bacterium]
MTSPLLRSSLLAGLPGVVHGFTTRALYIPPPPPEASDPAALAGALEALGAPGAEVAMLDQVHGARVHVLAPGGPRWPVGPGDALVSTLPGAVVYVRVADCVPILIAGPRGVAAIHAGWRGTVAGVIQAAVAALRVATGHAPGELRAAMGPAIGPCCFEVGPEVVAGLEAHAPRELFLHPRPGQRPAVDLRAVCRHIIEELGIGQVEEIGPCTRCDRRFHSWRRDGPAAGRQAALIGVRP